MTPDLYLFDDRLARRWAPFTLTRPAGELLFGASTLRERSERVLGLTCVGHLSRTALIGFDEPGAPPAIGLADLPTDRPIVVLSSRVVLNAQGIDLPTDRSARLMVGGRPAGWVLPAGAPALSELWLRDPSGAPAEMHPVELAGSFLEHPWSIVSRNDDRLIADGHDLGWTESSPEGIHRIGEGIVSLADGAAIEPGVHIDVRDGPVRLEAGARVEGPARLTGPLWVGPDSTVLGGSVGQASIGRRCLVRGELTHAVLLGYVNKAHDGHMGHVLLGRWVNLGAFTTNSDLKNNYKSVRVWTPDGDVDTGEIKVGAFLGDHVKTGIGTLLNTGTVVGAGSNVFGGEMPPSAVPPFSWGAGVALGEHRLEDFLATARRVMARRDQTLTPGVEQLLRNAWHRTAHRRRGE